MIIVDVRKQNALNLFVYALSKEDIVKENVFVNPVKIKLHLKLKEWKIFKKCIKNAHVYYLIIFKWFNIKMKMLSSIPLAVNVKKFNAKKIFVFVIKKALIVLNYVNALIVKILKWKLMKIQQNKFIKKM